MTDEERDSLLLELKAGQDELKTGQDELKTGQDELKTGLDELRTSVDAGFAAAKRERDGLSNHLQDIAAVLREGGFPVPELDEEPEEATG